MNRRTLFKRSIAGAVAGAVVLPECQSGPLPDVSANKSKPIVISNLAPNDLFTGKIVRELVETIAKYQGDVVKIDFAGPRILVGIEDLAFERYTANERL